MTTVEVSTLSSLYDLAVTVQDLSETLLAPTIGGTPNLSYITAAEPAYDCCDSLIVWVSNIAEEVTNPLSPVAATAHRASYGRINLVQLHVVVLRCSAPLGKNGLPAPSAEQAVAEKVLMDGWALWTGFYAAIESEQFRGLCREVYFDFGVPVADQGGCVGWDFLLRTELAGIQS